MLMSYSTHQEKRNVVRELLSYGDKSISALKEISDIIAYAELRAACIQAIMEITDAGKNVGKAK